MADKKRADDATTPPSGDGDQAAENLSRTGDCAAEIDGVTAATGDAVRIQRRRFVVPPGLFGSLCAPAALASSASPDKWVMLKAMAQNYGWPI